MPGKTNISISQMRSSFGIPGGKQFPNPGVVILVDWFIHHSPPTRHWGRGERRCCLSSVQFPEGAGCPGKSRSPSISVHGSYYTEGSSHRTLSLRFSLIDQYSDRKARRRLEGRICKYTSTWILESHLVAIDSVYVGKINSRLYQPVLPCTTLLAGRNRWKYLTLWRALLKPGKSDQNSWMKASFKKLLPEAETSGHLKRRGEWLSRKSGIRYLHKTSALCSPMQHWFS